jgi:hypothetical protein
LFQFGRGKSIAEGGKVYHDMRSEFEAAWLHKRELYSAEN